MRKEQFPLQPEETGPPQEQTLPTPAPEPRQTLLKHRTEEGEQADSSFFLETNLRVVQANVGNLRGFLQYRAELEMHLQALDLPTCVALTETLLDKATGQAELTGYTLVSRRDRLGGTSGWGGVALFARSDCAARFVKLEDSEVAERTWYTVHTDHGPLLLAVWYRPPRKGEVDSVASFEAELNRLRTGALGTLVVGDLNVHNASWLRFSSGHSTEGRALEEVCDRCCLKQVVEGPTRGEYLLDLVLTDLHECCSATVHPKLSDHHVVECGVKLQVPRESVVVRECWLWKKANWTGLNSFFATVEWRGLLTDEEDPFAVFTNCSRR